MISNDDFDEYWCYRLAREHQRLHLGTDQGKYTIGHLTGHLTRNELYPSTPENS